MFFEFYNTHFFTAHSLEEQATMRKFLDDANIEHSVSAIDPNAPKGFYPAITSELLMTQNIEYKFYLKKNDLERAQALLETQWKYPN